MRALLLLSTTLLVACSNVGGLRPGGASAAIGGKIAYPSEVTPAMRICALREAAAPVCIDSPAGSNQYRIGHLAAGDYRVVASLVAGDMRVGGYMQQVQCIRAPCPALLKTVSVAAGAQLTDIDLNEFYAKRDDFPAIPVEAQ